MKITKASKQNGFTVLELLLVIAVSLVLVFLIFNSLGNYRKKEALRNMPTAIRSILAEARSLTLSSRTDDVYGVHFDADKIVRFKGAVYSSADPSNNPLVLDRATTISAIVLTGGGAEVLFEKRTGETDQYGTITLELVSDASQTRTITIHPTGLIE
jgi:prepilin-type N-terminal cleavage/methylation domain-containing protein